MEEFYRSTNIKSRLVEYMGGSSLQDVSCVYLTRCDVDMYNALEVRPPEELDFFLDRQMDIGRSMWDNDFLIAHLDIEYVNFDFPLEPYLNMKRSFQLQKPVHLTVEKILLGYGIAPLHLLSGRGHHYVWQIPRGSKVFNRISALRQIPSHLKNIYTEPHAPFDKNVPTDLGNGFAGMGLIMEFLGQQIKKEAAIHCELPVELTAIAVGPQKRGREMISLDLSEYGDPLHTRMIRMPFTIYRKHWDREAFGNPGLKKKLPPIFMIPLHEMGLEEAVDVMQDPQEVIQLAQIASVKIPVQEKPTERLIDDYESSELKHFHDWYYSQEPEPPGRWQETYDQLPMEILPYCVQQILEYPNDKLLKPEGIELVVRTMMALGWHPRHIAGLIRSKYERDYNWGQLWYIYDADTRADLYTRLFSGLFFTGIDNLVDFNCVSANEKKICSQPVLDCSLEKFRESLIERRKYDRLASRPFNRLFLPDEHL